MVASPSRKIMCPDCSPPSIAPVFSISSSTYLSPTLARSMWMPELRQRDLPVPCSTSWSRPQCSLSARRAPACRGAASRSTASPFTTLPVGIAEQGAVGIAIKGDAQVEFVPAVAATVFATVSGCSAPQLLIDVLPVRAAVQKRLPACGMREIVPGASAVAAPLAQSTSTRNRLRSVVTFLRQPVRCKPGAARPRPAGWAPAWSAEST